MQYHDLDLVQYVYLCLKKANMTYGFENKNILFLFLNESVDHAKFFLKFGAKHVWFANPSFNFEEIEDGKITKIGFKQIKDIPDNSLDLVIGLEILEHILKLEEFNDLLLQKTKDIAKIQLQGCPIWTSPKGHHIWLPKYKFNDMSNPFEPWEHLAYNDKDEMSKALVSKGISKNDSKEISDWIFNEEEINRYSMDYIINGFVKDSYNYKYNNSVIDKASVWIKKFLENNIEYNVISYITNVEHNEFYEIAQNYYSEKELNTDVLIINIFKRGN